MWAKYGEGIWIYRQNDGYLASAISRSESPVLRDIRMRLRKENHFILEPLVRDLLVQIVHVLNLPFHPALDFIGPVLELRGYIDIFKDFHTQQFPRPYQGDELSAPPARIATAGRLNRAGVSFLYLASDAHTAACEVRPHPSHLLSIGAFESTRPLRIANFATEISAFAENDIQLDLFHFVHSTDRAMGFPVLPGATDRYTVTQLIADVLRQLGYDGVAYASSLSEGQNICIFDPGVFVAVEGSAEVLRVEKLAYGLTNVDFRTEPELMTNNGLPKQKAAALNNQFRVSDEGRHFGNRRAAFRATGISSDHGQLSPPS